MRRNLFVIMLSAIGVSVAGAQQQSGCTGPRGVPVDSLKAHAARLHPDALKPENKGQGVIVALVYDNKCTILRHGMKRLSLPASVDDILNAVFPDSSRVSMASFEISGFSTLIPLTKEEADKGPVIAWGLLTPRGIPR